MIEPRADPHSARRRVVSDASGVRWEIFEHTPTYDRRALPTLVFSSTEVVRRVRSFPENWHELPEDALLALSENR